MERLHKVLAAAGVCSRRAAERLIEAGRVHVNGRPVTRLGSLVDPAHDAIQVDGRSIRPPAAKIYLALHKPRGYVTTLSDPEGRPTVADLLRGVRERVYPVGRLDYHSEGLLVVTNDGTLAHELMHPRKGVSKSYSVKVRGRPEAAALRRLEKGVPLDGRRTLPARLRLERGAANSWLEITVVEGRRHLVRRMLESIGHPVLKLRRVRFDGIRLGALPPGQWRHLTTVEIQRLKRGLGRAAGAPRGRRPRST